MPLLNKADLEALQAKPIRVCEVCGRPVRPSYCRNCDVFCETGHLILDCEGAGHDVHRTY